MLLQFFNARFFTTKLSQSVAIEEFTITHFELLFYLFETFVCLPKIYTMQPMPFAPCVSQFAHTFFPTLSFHLIYVEESLSLTEKELKINPADCIQPLLIISFYRSLLISIFNCNSILKHSVHHCTIQANILLPDAKNCFLFTYKQKVDKKAISKY